MLNQFVPFFHFKMERLSLLKHLTQEGDCMCPIGSTLKEIHKISVEGDCLQVHVLVFWTRLSTTDIYKVIENSNLSPEKNQHHNNIFGQYVDFESHNTRSSHELRHGQLSPAKFGFYNKYKNINFVPVSENRISGNGDRFNQNDIVIGTREGTKSCQDLSEPSQESFYNSSRIGQGYRSPIIYYTSNGTSKDSVQIFPTTTNYVSKGKNELSFSNNIKHQVKIQISLVHRELDVSQLRNFFSIESTHK